VPRIAGDVNSTGRLDRLKPGAASYPMRCFTHAVRHIKRQADDLNIALRECVNR
jgi:hypothetical protein